MLSGDIDERIEIRASGFDYVNRDARVVLVGICPGNAQMVAARDGKSSREIKRENAFAGGMRSNLVRMLDFVGVNRLLRIATCKTLWDQDFDKVEMTSLLKDAVYYKGKMFNNVAMIGRSMKLTRLFREGFLRDCSAYKSARLFVALGPGVHSVLLRLKAENVISGMVIGMPHPSGANAGRCAAFLGCSKVDAKVDGATRWALERAAESLQVVKSMIESGQ